MDKKSKYFWNKSFVRLINNNICPYCEESLLIKGITKTCDCNFYIRGAPETLAFTEVKSENAPPIDNNTCPECLGFNFKYDDIRAETYCLDCGLVLEGPMAYCGGRIKLTYPWQYTFEPTLLYPQI